MGAGSIRRRNERAASGFVGGSRSGAGRPSGFRSVRSSGLVPLGKCLSHYRLQVQSEQQAEPARSEFETGSRTRFSPATAFLSPHGGSNRKPRTAPSFKFRSSGLGLLLALYL